MLVKLEEYADIPFSTRDPYTAISAALTNPVATCYEEGSLTPMALPLGASGIEIKTLTAVGQYMVRIQCRAALGFIVGKTYSVRVKGTIDDVTDETQVGVFQISAENHGTAIDLPISQSSDKLTAQEVWEYTIRGQNAETILAIAGAGAGGGAIDVGIVFDTSDYRTESIKDFLGVEIVNVEADRYGNRRNLTITP